MQTSTHPQILSHPMAYSDTLIQHGAWLLIQNYVAESTNIKISARLIPHMNATYEIRIVVTPKNGMSIVFVEQTTDSLLGFPSDELVTNLMMIG